VRAMQMELRADREAGEAAIHTLIAKPDHPAA
jgi:hypothetical protein